MLRGLGFGGMCQFVSDKGPPFCSKMVRSRKKHNFSQYYEDLEWTLCSKNPKIALSETPILTIFDPFWSHFLAKKDTGNDDKKPIR